MVKWFRDGSAGCDVGSRSFQELRRSLSRDIIGQNYGSSLSCLHRLKSFLSFAESHWLFCLQAAYFQLCFIIYCRIKGARLSAAIVRRPPRRSWPPPPHEPDIPGSVAAKDFLRATCEVLHLKSKSRPFSLASDCTVLGILSTVFWAAASSLPSSGHSQVKTHPIDCVTSFGPVVKDQALGEN